MRFLVILDGVGYVWDTESGVVEKYDIDDRLTCQLAKIGCIIPVDGKVEGNIIPEGWENATFYHWIE